MTQNKELLEFQMTTFKQFKSIYEHVKLAEQRKNVKDIQFNISCCFNVMLSLIIIYLLV
jgi:hypothetical protein